MRRNLMLFGAAFVAGLIIVVGSAVGERFMAVPDVEEPDQPDPSPTAEERPDRPDLPDMTEYRDDEWGFAVSYPADWERIATADPAVRLLATPNGEESILIRVVTLDAEVGDDDLPLVRTFTDEIVREGDGVEILAEPAGVDLGGFPGLYYLYTFTDTASGSQGAHLHYFLFDGDTMITIVLQALPPEDLERLAPTFQAIVESFRSI